MNATPIPSAKPIVWGLGLAIVGAPVLAWFDVVVGRPGFFNFLAVVAGLTGLGLLLYGAYAFFTSFDAVAARYVAANGPAATHDPTSSTPVASSSTPSPTFPRGSSGSSSRRGSTTAGSLLAGPPTVQRDAAPTTPRGEVRIVATPFEPSDDDDE